MAALWYCNGMITLYFPSDWTSREVGYYLQERYPTNWMFIFRRYQTTVTEHHSVNVLLINL